MWMLWAVLMGCGDPEVKRPEDVDRLVLQQNFSAACKGLDSDWPELRMHTVRSMADFPDHPPSAECLCSRVVVEGKWDQDIARGVEGSRRDDLAMCMLEELPNVTEDPGGYVRAIGGILSRDGAAAFADLAVSAEDPAVRAAAAASLRPVSGATETLLKAKGDEDPMVRASAVYALEGRDKSIAPQVADLLLADDDPDVRMAAAKALKTIDVRAGRNALCHAMMEDPDPRVREAAVRAFEGTKDSVGVSCVGKRMGKKEESAKVRQAVLDVLASNDTHSARKFLCDGMQPWVKMYVRDQPVWKLEGVDIARRQNDVDFDRSYDCVMAALKKGGLSCYGRHYLSTWASDLGANITPRACPGM